MLKASKCPFPDCSTIEERVKNLLVTMTLEEKIAQLGSIPALDLLENGRFSKEKAAKLLGNG
ncbi:MAG: hypothetical protein QXH91_07915, partial [Candidatus Bathyarchaeia archaeon]